MMDPIHGTTDFWGDPVPAYDADHPCAVEGCDRLIGKRARFCKRHGALKHGTKVRAQVARLLALADQRRDAEEMERIASAIVDRAMRRAVREACG